MVNQQFNAHDKFNYELRRLDLMQVKATIGIMEIVV
jgi:hypothetical protein